MGGELENAVETLRPAESYSNLRSAATAASRSPATVNHPYSASNESVESALTRDSRTERLLEQLPVATRPSPSPSESLTSLQFDPDRDLAAAWTLYPRQSHHDHDGDRGPADSSSVVTASRSISPRPASPAPPSTYNPGAPLRFDEHAKARMWDQQRGRKKLRYWGLFWLVVIGGTALGIGIAAAVKSKSRPPSASTAATASTRTHAEPNVMVSASSNIDTNSGNTLSGIRTAASTGTSSTTNLSPPRSCVATPADDRDVKSSISSPRLPSPSVATNDPSASTSNTAQSFRPTSPDPSPPHHHSTRSRSRIKTTLRATSTTNPTPPSPPNSNRRTPVSADSHADGIGAIVSQLVRVIAVTSDA